MNNLSTKHENDLKYKYKQKNIPKSTKRANNLINNYTYTNHYIQNDNKQ